MVHLAVRMHCNWPTDHAIDHSSIGLNRLTIELVFNEVSLFTFSKETHGFDVTVLKNYLKAFLFLMNPWCNDWHAWLLVSRLRLKGAIR